MSDHCASLAHVAIQLQVVIIKNHANSILLVVKAVLHVHRNPRLAEDVKQSYGEKSGLADLLSWMVNQQGHHCSDEHLETIELDVFRDVSFYSETSIKKQKVLSSRTSSTILITRSQTTPPFCDRHTTIHPVHDSALVCLLYIVKNDRFGMLPCWIHYWHWKSLHQNDVP